MFSRQSHGAVFVDAGSATALKKNSAATFCFAFLSIYFFSMEIFLAKVSETRDARLRSESWFFLMTAQIGNSGKLEAEPTPDPIKKLA